MKLAIDSTQNFGSVALATDERLLYSAFFDIRITHSETLMPAVDQALKICGGTPGDLKSVYVCRGPGSFTGLRIGVSTAQGIAFGLNLPLFAYSALELYALSACGLGKNILVALDAKMKEVYFAAYDSELHELIPPQVGKPEALADLGLQAYFLCGTAAEMVKEGLREAEHDFYVPNRAHRYLGAAGLFELAALLPDKHRPQNPVELEPLYLRESTAQVNLPPKTKE